MVADVAERAFIDTWARSDAPTAKGYGVLVALDVLGGSGPTRVAYLQTALPCPPRATIVSAKLRVTQYGAAASGTRTLSLRKILAKWAETTLTWTHKPARSSTVSASATVAGAGAPGRVVEFDVTADVQAWANGAANYGWTLESSAAQLFRIYSKNATWRRPQLLVEWTMAPERPTNVQPAGGLFGADPKPMLRWTYADRGSQIQPLAKAQLHIKVTNASWSSATGYAAPDYDSGVVATTIPQMTMAAPGFNGIQAGQTVWFTLRHQDSSGIWSTWSDPQQVGYAPPPSVTITAPTALRDTSAVIAWSAATQERVQVIVRDATTGVTLWDTGSFVDSAVRAVTMPRGLIRTLGAKVLVIVRVWDGLDRVAVPGFTTYAQDTRTLTYADTTSVAPVTDLAAVESAERPTTRLAWSRAAGASQFGIWVDGVEVLVDDAADLATGTAGGVTTYACDVAVPLGKPRTLMVKAIVPVTVDGIEQTHASANSPSISYERELFAVWLTVPGDPSRDIRFLQESSDIVETSMPEVNARFDPVGSSVPVHVTSVLRWFEGSITDGVLADYGDLTADDLRARVLRAKGDRLTTYTLLWGEHAVPVHIFNVDVAGDWIPGAHRYLVSLDFTAAVPSPEYELQ